MRAQLDLVAKRITEQAKAKAVDGQVLNWLCADQERLAKQERVLSGRPLPGSRPPPAGAPAGSPEVCRLGARIPGSTTDQPSHRRLVASNHYAADPRKAPHPLAAEPDDCVLILACREEAVLKHELLEATIARVWRGRRKNYLGYLLDSTSPKRQWFPDG